MSTKNTFEDLVEVIREDPSGFDLLLEELEWYRDYIKRGEDFEADNPKLKPFVGDLELIESHGGEGEGTDYWKIFSYQGRTLKLTGSWISWDGASFASASLDEVEARQVMVTAYAKTKNLF